VLYAGAEPLGRALIEALRTEPALVVGENEPYRIEIEGDYTIPVHGDQRGLPAALVEVRQDLLATPAEIESWADRLTRALRSAALDPEGTAADGRR
jgi:predicted N-formylglutamate amidohydrolase